MDNVLAELASLLISARLHYIAKQDKCVDLLSSLVPRLSLLPRNFPSGGSTVKRGIIARKEGEPGNEATTESHGVHISLYPFPFQFPFLSPLSLPSTETSLPRCLQKW